MSTRKGKKRFSSVNTFMDHFADMHRGNRVLLLDFESGENDDRVVAVLSKSGKVSYGWGQGRTWLSAIRDMLTNFPNSL
jgi:hypothetical protein